MSIENGLVKLIDTGLTNAGVTTPGGFFIQLGKDDVVNASAPMAWTYRFVFSEPSYHLAGQTQFTAAVFRIDCHGHKAKHAIQLARAIDGVLRGGFRGTLPDDDQTYVDSLQREPEFMDGFNDTSRTFVRSLEYVINFHQQ